MGLFDFIAEKKKQREEVERQRLLEAQKQQKLEQQRLEREEEEKRIRAAKDAEEKRLLEIEQAKNREAHAAITANDNERFMLGAKWLLQNGEPILKASISKIGKETEDYYYTIPYNIEVGDLLEFHHEYDVEKDRTRLVVLFDNEEIGELSNSINEKLINYDIDNLVGVVSKVNDEDDLKITALVYEGSDFSEPGYRQLHTYIAGTRFNNEDGSSRQDYLAREFRSTRLKLEKSEYNGEPAVKVLSARGFQLGYLKSDLAEEFCRRLDKGQIGGIYVNKINKKDDVLYCDIVINIANF